MKAKPRSARIFWIASVLLLAGSILGAGFAMNSGVLGSGQSPKEPDDAKGALPPRVMAKGYVDGEFGVTNLYPIQPGRVLQVRDEGFVAKKKGDWLLKLDPALAKLRLQEAEAVFSQAQKLPSEHKLKVEQQKLAIAIARHKFNLADLQLQFGKRALDKLENPDQSFKDKVALAEEEVKAMECAVKVEEINLNKLNLLDPAKNLDRARAVRDQAKLALDECDVTAPGPGTLLRVMVHPGEALGSNPKLPAMQFVQDGRKIIRAEVLQEWASMVKEKQTVEIEDDTNSGQDKKKWTGTIKSLSTYFGPKRSIILEPFVYNDVRTLECIILVDQQHEAALRIGQRVRVAIHTSGP